MKLVSNFKTQGFILHFLCDIIGRLSKKPTSVGSRLYHSLQIMYWMPDFGSSYQYSDALIKVSNYMCRFVWLYIHVGSKIEIAFYCVLQAITYVLLFYKMLSYIPKMWCKCNWCNFFQVIFCLKFKFSVTEWLQHW